MYPDANAIYWTTLTSSSQAAVSRSKATSSRHAFSRSAPTTRLENPSRSTYDVNFVLGPGSENPFTTPAPPAEASTPPSFPNPTYRHPIAPSSARPSINLVLVQGYVVIRAYLPYDLNVKQNVLPNITILFNGHPLKTVAPCKNLSSSLRLLLYNVLVRSWNGNNNPPGATRARSAYVPSSYRRSGWRSLSQ